MVGPSTLCGNMARDGIIFEGRGVFALGINLHYWSTFGKEAFETLPER